MASEILTVSFLRATGPISRIRPGGSASPISVQLTWQIAQSFRQAKGWLRR